MGKMGNPKMILFDILFLSFWTWMYASDRNSHAVMGPIIIGLSLINLVINIVLFAKRRNQQPKEHHA
jgi:hypothetical protein